MAFKHRLSAKISARDAIALGWVSGMTPEEFFAHTQKEALANGAHVLTPSERHTVMAVVYDTYHALDRLSAHTPLWTPGDKRYAAR